MNTPISDLEALERRVAALEQEVEGEKVVSRYILEQVRRNGDDLAALRSRTDRVEGRLDRVEARLDRIEARLDRIEAQVDRIEAQVLSLRTDLPKMIADTMREVLRERDGQR